VSGLPKMVGPELLQDGVIQTVLTSWKYRFPILLCIYVKNWDKYIRIHKLYRFEFGDSKIRFRISHCHAYVRTRTSSYSVHKL
jgi:hypothetical protein